MTPWYRFLTDLGDRGGETAIRSIRRAALAISANNFLLPEQVWQYGRNKFVLPEQKWIDGDMHARPVSDIFSEHMST